MKRILLAAILCLLVLALQWPAPAPLRLAVAWLIIFASGLFWQPAPIRSGSWMLWTSVAGAACLHLLALLVLMQLFGLGPSRFVPALLASWVLPLAWRQWRAGGPSSPGDASAWPFALVACALAAWLATHAPELDLGSDAPAHLGAIVDAAAQDRWRPLDRSAPGLSEGLDPRFGIWHGLYAALSRWLALSPELILRFSPVLLAPLWLLAHAQLFSLWIPRAKLALLVALTFTLGGADGRGFGSVFAAYPASVSLAMAALALSSLARKDAAAKTWWTTESLLLGASAMVHPFGWWVSLLLLAHAILLQRFFGGRRWAGSLLRALPLAVAVGLLAMWPTLAQRSQSAGGPHTMPLNVVFLQAPFFVCDPLRVLRWGGGLCLAVLPLALLFARRSFGGARSSLLASGWICVWSVALNPLLQPWIYSLVGYLSERLGRVAYPEVLGALLLARPWTDRYRPRRRGARLLLFAIALVGAWLVGRSCVYSMRALRSDVRPNPQWQRVHEIATELESRPDATLLADPRLSYGLRALRGGAVALYPLAHASPNDRELPARLAAYRDLLDPSADEALLRAALRRLGADLLLLRADVERDGEPSFGFVADDEKQLRLHGRLAAGGSLPLAGGKDWWLYDGTALRFGPAVSWPAPCEPDTLRSLALGSRFDVVGVRGPASVVAGATLELELRYRAHAETMRTVHPDFERVHLRLSGPMPQLASWLQPIGKPIRKLLIERSGRSEARFGAGYIPFGAYAAPSRWPHGIACERVRLPVPRRMPAGNYKLEITVQEATWQPRYDWRDFLSDQDRYSGTIAATIEIREPAP